MTTTTIRKPCTLNLTAPEVRAMLAGRKLAHVLPVKFNKSPWLNPLPHVEYARDGMPIWWDSPPSESIRQSDYYDHGMPCPLGQPGDTVLCREAWSFEPPRDVDYPVRVTYRIDKHVAKIDPDSVQWEGLRENGPGENWRHVNTMPAWAVRLRPIIESVAVKRVQDVTVSEARACGIIDREYQTHFCPEGVVAVDGNAYLNVGSAWSSLWETRYAKRGLSWESNPWLWLVKWRLPTC